MAFSSPAGAQCRARRERPARGMDASLACASSAGTGGRCWRHTRPWRRRSASRPPAAAAEPHPASGCTLSTLRVHAEIEPPQQPQSQPQPQQSQQQEQANRGKRNDGPDQEPDGGGPSRGGDASRMRHFLLLLSEYGGVYGTAAVVLAAVTRIDPFGGLHWALEDMALGLALFTPAFLFDALVGLPDWTTRQEDAARLATLFLDPAYFGDTRSTSSGGAAAQHAGDEDAAQGGSPGTSASAPAGEAEGQRRARMLHPAGALAAAVPALAVGAAASSAHSRTPGGVLPRADRPSALWAVGQRLRLALELMQESGVRNNPRTRLTQLQELAVIVVSCVAEESLYRAVLLTLFARWLRDRFYEAGADDTLSLPLHHVQLDTAAVAEWAVLGFGIALGAAVFAARAWQEATIASRLESLLAMQREQAEKSARKQRLAGYHITEAELQAERERQARLDAASASLTAAIGAQGALVWGLEGVREVYQVTAAGAAFLLTGNLAAPLVGSIAAEALVMVYQRLALRRSIQRRAELVARRRAAQQRQAQERTRGAAAVDARGGSGSSVDGDEHSSRQ